MKYMLDTDTCIYTIKNNPSKVKRRVMQKEPGDICISAITYAELVNGAEKSQNRIKNRIALNMFIADFKVIDFDVAAAESYGEIRSKLERRGETIGPNDLLIAAHAKSLGLTLVSNNTREFGRVDGLEIENWT